MSNKAVSRFEHEMAQPVSDRITGDKTAAYTTKPYELRVTADTSGGAFTITLCPPAQAPGVMQVIYLTTAGNNLTVSGQGMSNVTLDLAGESVACYSDGVEWHDMEAAGYS